MNVDERVAIDVHGHAEVSADGHPALPDHLMTGPSGSGFPLPTPDRWLSDLDTLDIKPDVRPLILKEHAARPRGPRITGDA